MKSDEGSFLSKFMCDLIHNMHKAVDINRENLNIIGIEFPNLKSIETTANAMRSYIFEGFEPTS